MTTNNTATASRTFRNKAAATVKKSVTFPSARKQLTASSMFFATTMSFAQLPDVRVVPETAVGKVMATQNEIKAREYIFPERINDVRIDTVSGSIAVQLPRLRGNGKMLKNRGEMVVYDIAGEKVKWSKKTAYNKRRIRLCGSTVVHTKTGFGVKTCGLNIENGKRLWRAATLISFIDPAAQMGIGYKYAATGKYINTLEGINLQTGKVMWQREISHEHGWSDVFQLNDSVWMIVAAGLHTINVHDGSGWSCYAVTDEKDYRVANAVNVAGLALGLLTGTFVFSTRHNLVSNIHSNIYTDSAGYYMASKEKVSRIRINGAGTEYWWSLLPEDVSSKSSIFAKGDTLYMINHGFAFMNGLPVNFGNPFFAAFDKETGWQLFYHPFNDHKKNPVIDFKAEDNYVWLIFKNKIMKCSLLDGSLMLEKLIDTSEPGELKYLAGNRIYMATGNSTLTNLLLSDTSKNYIMSTKGKVLMFDAQLNITGTVDKNLLYFVYETIGDYKVAVNDYHTIILDASNNKVAELNIVGIAYLTENKLYSIREKSIIEIDVTAVVEQLQTLPATVFGTEF